MYEDALEYCDFALKIDKSNSKTLYRKATALAFLYKFEESKSIFNQLDDGKKLIGLVTELES
jgi:tetratricopeptide (TPR) repeat protein